MRRVIAMLDRAEGNGEVGEYSVGFDDGWWAQLEGVEFWDWETPEDPRSYSGPVAGMNACKADYETRILATLEKIE